MLATTPPTPQMTRRTCWASGLASLENGQPNVPKHITCALNRNLSLTVSHDGSPGYSLWTVPDAGVFGMSFPTLLYISSRDMPHLDRRLNRSSSADHTRSIQRQ